MPALRMFVALLLFGMAGVVSGDEVLVAVAANFADVANELAPGFQKATGHRAKLSIGASGKFAAQIENGAPFDLFLSADAERPAGLEAKGLAVKGTRFVYAVGRLALWSPESGLVDAGGAVLRGGNFARLAIANPLTAPYGEAAVETLKRMNLWDVVRPKVVQGENIGQTFQFVASGNAQLGFVALSQVLALDPAARGSWWEVPENLHGVIAQEAVLLKPGEHNPAARAFLDYLKSEPARAIIRRYGYGL